MSVIRKIKKSTLNAISYRKSEMRTDRPERARAMCGVKEREPERNFRIQVTNTECRGINSKETTRLSSQIIEKSNPLNRQNTSPSTPKLKGLRPQYSVLCHQKVLSYETKFDLSVHLSIHSVTALQQCYCTLTSRDIILPTPLQPSNPTTSNINDDDLVKLTT